MTTAPAPLLLARRILLDALDMHPGISVGSDLDPAEVGIVGDSAHVGGYHCGTDRCTTSDYSVRESSRDRAGFDLDASALDIGKFAYASEDGRIYTLVDFNRWLVAECQSGGPYTGDVREVIYSLDGVTVRRWDRLGLHSGGDSSHTEHTHISFFRDSNGRSAPELMQRWLDKIGAGDMTPAEMWAYVYNNPPDFPNPSGYTMAQIQLGTNKAAWGALAQAEAVKEVVDAIAVDVAAIKVLLEDGDGSADLAPILAKLEAMEERLTELISAPSNVSLTMSLSGSGSGSATPKPPTLPGT